MAMRACERGNDSDTRSVFSADPTSWPGPVQWPIPVNHTTYTGCLTLTRRAPILRLPLVFQLCCPRTIAKRKSQKHVRGLQISMRLEGIPTFHHRDGKDCLPERSGQTSSVVRWSKCRSHMRTIFYCRRLLPRSLSLLRTTSILYAPLHC